MRTTPDHPYNLPLMTRDQVLERLTMPQGLRAQQVTTDARGPKLEVKGENLTLRLSRKHQFPVTPEALPSILDMAGIPAGLAKRTPTNLLAPLIEYHLGSQDKMLAVWSDNGLVRLQDLDKTFPIFEAEETLQNIATQFPEAKYQKAAMRDDLSYDLLAITHDNPQILADKLAPGTHEFLPKDGDPFRAGVHLHMSPIGAVSPRIEPYIVRLVCTNGAIHAEYLSAWDKKGYGERDELWHWFRQGMQDSADRVNTIFDTYTEMMRHEIPPGEPRMLAVEGMIKEAKLGKEAASTLRDKAIAVQPATMYDLYNLLTDVATHYAKDLEDEVKRITRAGQMAKAGPVSWCPTCHRN